MKKFFKVLVPVLLTLAIIASTAWYFLVYDQNFTRDLILRQARYFESVGNHNTSAYLYHLAYRQSSQNQDVAIELAQQYKSIGNYTKAEYTLSNAIADGGTSELYIALCKTYVEQDKLLDAVTMLDNIADPAIKAELDARRPAKPAFSADAGFYTQYIDVAVSCGSGTLYVTADGTYPSTKSSGYTGPISLSVGETTIYALAVDESGLVSPMHVASFTVGGIVEKVSFTDPAMEAAIRDAIGVSGNAAVFTNNLWSVTEFSVPQDAASLDDLVLLPYLRSVSFEDMTLDSLAVLSKMTYLETVSMKGCQFPADDLSFLAQLHGLTSLTMVDCGLSTISGLSNAPKLSYLDLSSNAIRNIDPLATIPTLRTVLMPHNALNDLNVLTQLSNLQKLDVSYNSLKSISPLSSCLSLNWLDISQNSITNLTSLQNLSAMTYLSAAHNAVTNVTPLAKCTALSELDLSNNAIEDIASLSTLGNLTNFNFSYNNVKALPAWPSDTPLLILDGSYNQLEDISVLGSIQTLNYVYLDYNKLTSIDALGDCHRLMRVNAFGNAIADVSALTDHSIVVNYDPSYQFEIEPTQGDDEDSDDWDDDDYDY